MSSDGTYENAYSVEHGWLVPPYGGTFVQCYSGDYEICAFVIDLTTEAGTSYAGQTLGVTVWNDAGGEPGNVLCLVTGIQPTGIGYWPEITRHEFEAPAGCCVTGDWWAGVRSEWDPESWGHYWYYAADDPGTEGCPMFYAPEGMMFGGEEGWYPIDDLFGPTAAMGIGALVRPCPPVPVEEASWGRVKTLYR